MNLEQIIYRVGEIGASNTRMLSDVPDFVNQAQRTICERNNWNFMHQMLPIVMPAGAFITPCPDNYKEAAPEKSPSTYTSPSIALPLPVIIRSRAEVQRRLIPGTWPFTAVNQPFSKVPIVEIFFEQNADGVWTLNLPPWFPNSEQVIYNVSCYTYLAPLQNGNDRNGLTNHGLLSEALINLAKHFIWASDDPTDKRAIAALSLYEDLFEKAWWQQAHQRNAGRSMHMGGG